MILSINYLIKYLSIENSIQVTNTLFRGPELGLAEERVIEQIADLRQSSRFRMHQPRRWHGWLRRMSFNQAVRGSNSIEGFNASLEDAIAVDLDEDPLDTVKETRQAVAGYRSAMTYILQLTDEPGPVYSEQLLKSLHFMMVGHDLDAHPGRWRTGDIYVRDAEAGEITYQGPDVELVGSLMGELVVGLNEADRSEGASSSEAGLVKAAIAHLNLIMIHPFRDGNGRMARALQTLVLAREGIGNPVFSSIEEYLGAATRAYYDVLQLVGGRRWQPENDTRPWIRFVLTAHLRQARRILRRIRETERLWDELEDLLQRRSLPDRHIEALAPAAWGLSVRTATYRAAVGDISEATASRDLLRLSASGLLVPHGEKRGRHYRAAPELRALREAIIANRDHDDDRDPFA